MDPPEDLSARVLLKHILSTEPPRTPITRSASKTQATVPSRRSSRLGGKDAGARTPQDILRRSLRNKMRESITRKSLPAANRRAASVALRQTHTPAPTSVLFDDADTPRHILMNILQTEPARSPVVHTQAESEDPQSSSANSSVASKRPSIELSGLDFPDLTIGNIASTAKGLSRKRPRRSLNVTAFEKRLKDGGDIEGEDERSIGDQSSLSLSSSSSLSLKTPFVDVRTEKRGLQRRVSNRRKITEESFGAAVNKRHIGEVSSYVEQGPSETAFSEGFTLGLSKLGEPDVTADIVHCNTALYAQPDAMTSNVSIVATQDKPTVMASQLQAQILEMETEAREAEHSKLVKERSAYLLPTEEGVGAEAQSEGCFSLAAETYTETRKSTAEGPPGDAAAALESEEEEGTVECQNNVGGDAAESEQEKRSEVQTESQNEEEGVGDSPTEDDEEGEVDSQPEENAAPSQSDEEEVAPDSQTEEDDAVDSPTEDDEEDEVNFQPEENTAPPQSGEEDVAPDSQTEEDGAVDSPVEDGEESDVHFQPEGGAAANSQSDEDEGPPDSQTEEEAGAGDSETGDCAPVDSQSDEEDAAGSQIDQDNAEGGFADSQAEDDHDKEEGDEQVSEELEWDVEHVSRRAHRSGSGVVPVGEAESGWSDGKSKAHDTFDIHNSLEMGTQESNQPDLGIPDLAESSTQGQKDVSKLDVDEEKSLHASDEDGGQLSDESPDEAAAGEPAVQEEGWEDEDGEESEAEVPSKTPAFVRQKRKIFHPDPQVLPAVLQEVQASTSDNLPAPKRKQVRKRSRPATKEGGLPKTYLMKVFKHFAKTKVSADVYPVLKETMDKFFVRLAEDLETYALHAKRKTIEVEDVELLLKRQGHVNDKVPVEVLIEKYLRMDQRKLLIPIATSGNVVTPASRR